MKRKVLLAVVAASLFITYFLFIFARASAVANRGTETAFGGEFLILLTPVIVLIVCQNIKLSMQIYKHNKSVEQRQEEPKEVGITLSEFKGESVK